MHQLRSKKGLCGRRPNNNHFIFNENQTVKKATEPSNIIWESYSISDKQRKIRKVVTIIILIVVYTFFIILFCLEVSMGLLLLIYFR